MSAKLDELINNAKITELLNKKKQEEENKSCILLILAIIGAVAGCRSRNRFCSISLHES